MLGTLIFLVSAQAATQPVAAPILSFKDGVFRIVDAGVSESVGIKPAVSKNIGDVFQEKVGSKYVVFDKRGLTVRFGSKARTWKLEDFLTSPKFFARDQIIENVARIESGELVRAASGLAGWERVDHKLYLMPRWTTRGNMAFLEAVVSVDLDQPEPNYTALGVMPQPSIGQGMIHDSLYSTLGGFASVAADGEKWGICYLPEGSLKAAFQPVGVGRPDFSLGEKGRLVRFIEKTSYGTYLAGTIKSPEGTRTNLAESRDPIEFLGEDSDAVLVRGPMESLLRNTNSGLELVLPKDVGARRVKAGVLVWTPRQSPKLAMLYALHSLRSSAKWTSQPSSSGAGTAGRGSGSRKPPAQL